MKIAPEFSENIVQIKELLKIKAFLTILVNFDHFDYFLPILFIFGSFWWFYRFLTIFGNLGQFWAFWPFFAILVNVSHFLPFWAFWSFLTIFGNFRNPRGRRIRLAGSITNIYDFHILHPPPPPARTFI